MSGAAERFVRTGGLVMMVVAVALAAYSLGAFVSDPSFGWAAMVAVNGFLAVIGWELSTPWDTP